MLRPRHAALGHRLAAALLALGLLPFQAARAQTFVDPAFAAQTVVTLPSFQVVGMTWASDGTMFIWQKNGVVRLFRDGSLLPTPFLDFRGRVNTYDDRGMLGLTVDPDFAANGYVYLAYVYEGGADPNDTGPKISRLTRVTADPANKDVMLAGSEVILIDNMLADAGGHTAGTLRFAPDGTLFLSNGDGADAAFANSLALGAQDIDSFSGKIIRINPDGSAPAPPQVTNPWYDGTNSIRSKIYAIGLRNAFRYAFHPILGDLYACDVGWNTYEEVDRVVPGENYGWPCYEGFEPVPEYQSLFPGTCGPLAPSAVEFPLYAYDRSEGSAVVGGAFYTGNAYPASYTNSFFFSDYTGGWMRRLVFNPDGSIDQNLLFATDIGVPVSTEVGPDGLLYFADYVTGEIRRLVYDGPVAVASATPSSGYSPLLVNFSSAGSGGGPLTYSWAFGDGATSNAANPSHTYTTGQVQSYEAELTVTNAQSATSSASVTITVGSLPPTPSIQSPPNGSGVQPGETVFYSGSATDPDETLPASALHWEILLHHNTHIHSFVGGTGSSGSFVAQYHGAGTYSYELILTATDSSGLSASTSVQIPVLADTGLVAAYAFNDGTGSTVADLSDNGNDGSISGASWTASGRYGQALSFDGVDDLVVIPESSSLDLTTGMTIEAWVYPTSALSGPKAILEKEVDAYYLNANTGGNRIGVGGMFAGSCCATLQGPNALPVNQWTHVAGTYDGASLRLYVNGAQVASQDRTGSLQVNGYPVRIGASTYSSEFFPGRIDELRIYDRALSLSEIQSDMNTPLPEPGSMASLLAGAGALGWLRRRRRDARWRR